MLIQAGAGSAAHFTDDAYMTAGAEVTDADDVRARSDVLLRVAPRPPPGQTEGMRPGSLHAGLLRPLERAAEVAGWPRRT